MKIILNKFGFLLILVAILFNACSELDNDYQPVSARTTVHTPGFNRAPHRTAIRENNWDMTECKKCHGIDYTGGISNNSCNRCHRNSPEACNVCHGGNANAAPPSDVSGSPVAVGAHQTHLIGNISAGIECTECHIVPKNYNDPGHIDFSGSDVHPQKVFFNASLANTITKGRNSSSMTANFINNRQDIECANTYCHGNFSNGNNYTPKWTKGSSDANCGSCHSLTPPLPHPQVMACFACHDGVVDPRMNIIDKSKHINGKLEVYGESITNW